MAHQNRSSRTSVAARAAGTSFTLAGTACLPTADSLPKPGFLAIHMPLSATFDADAAETLRDAAQAALADPFRRVVVASYTYRVRTPKPSRTPMRLRAGGVRDTAVARGVPACRTSLQPKDAWGRSGIESRWVEIELR